MADKLVAVPDVIYLRYSMFEDNRGFFAELWKWTEYLAAGLTFDFVQVNLSYSRPYVARGLHYQLKPSEHEKLVFAVWGRVFNVAVDIRRGSPHLGRWVAAELGPGDLGSVKLSKAVLGEVLAKRQRFSA